MREWIDAQTGRTVRQLTENPEGSSVGYFRVPRRLPDGRILARRHGEQRALIAIDINTGATQAFDFLPWLPMGLRETDGRLWYQILGENKICAVDLPDGTPQLIGELPGSEPHNGTCITCDGSTVVCSFFEVDQSQEYPLPTTLDPAIFWQWTARPRHGRLQAYDLTTGASNTVVELDGLLPIHADVSPTDPTLIKFAHDDYDAFCQRIWTVRTDGSNLTKIRPQQRGELVTHEFWWPDGQYIGYKYQDRRHDATIHDLPWAEYSPIPTQFGLANLDGEECYLSHPINHYHTHLNVSPDGKRLSGEGTDGDNVVHAAAFSMDSTRIDFVPHATVHTPYVPFKANQVNASFSGDGEWIIFNDTIDEVKQVCAVKVEV